jgi:hypothetical protein
MVRRAIDSAHYDLLPFPILSTLLKSASKTGICYRWVMKKDFFVTCSEGQLLLL